MRLTWAAFLGQRFAGRMAQPARDKIAIFAHNKFPV
jgi:hypothetical protein